jgi:hypothetical protein
MVYSCKKDDTADIKGDPDTKFFTTNANTGNMPVNSVNYAAINIPDAASSGFLNLSSAVPATIKIPVYATKPVTREVTISAEQDNSLVLVYNAAKKTSYVELPAGILNTQSLSARIPEGMTTSADSISIPVNAANLKTLTLPAYMAPIKLTTVSDPAAGSVTADTITRVVYVVLNIELRQIKYLAPTTDLTGSLLPKTSFAVSFNQTPATVGNILDGSTSTFAKWTTPLSAPVQVDLDMQASKNVTGFRLYSSTTSTLAPTQTDISVSDNGIDYKLIGSALRANVTYSSGYTYIVFYKPIPARYLRLNVSYSTSTNTQNGRMAELDVYAN